jgi:hypothetical protein
MDSFAPVSCWSIVVKKPEDGLQHRRILGSRFKVDWNVILILILGILDSIRYNFYSLSHGHVTTKLAFPCSLQNAQFSFPDGKNTTSLLP